MYSFKGVNWKICWSKNKDSTNGLYLTLAAFHKSWLFYPQKWAAKGDPMGDVFPFYCGLEKGVWHFQFSNGNPPFWNHENVLSPVYGWNWWIGWMGHTRSALSFIFNSFGGIYIEHVYIYLCILLRNSHKHPFEYQKLMSC